MEGTSAHETKILKDITAGKYRDCYLIYNRRSTDDPNIQKNSIKYQKSENTRFAFRNKLRIAIRCAECGRVYTPYLKKGITYYSPKCRDGCKNPKKCFNFTYITEKVGELITNLCFTDDELAEIDARASTDIALLETERSSQFESSERRKRKIREDLAYLNSNRLMLLKTGAYTPERLVAEEATLNFELDTLKQEEDTSDLSIRETVREVVKLSELLKNAMSIYSFANPAEKDKIIRVIVSELALYENTLEYKCRKGFVDFQAGLLPRVNLMTGFSNL
jgi:site-specific DNA recombinase